MRCRLWTIVVVAALMLVGAPTALAAPGEGPGGNDGSTQNPFERTDENRIEAPTLPDPVAPQVPSVVSDEIQLIGFSPMPIPANRGILNMTLACQKAYAGSRICTAAEIRQTVAVPTLHNAASFGSAWISSEGLPEELLQNQSDCLGWTSRSSQHRGTAIAIGPEHACYGGFVQPACNQELIVACCAAPSTIWPKAGPAVKPLVWPPRR